MKALDETTPLGPVLEELRATEHGHAAYLRTVAGGLGHDAHSRVAAQVADLLRARLADHGQGRQVVEEPHRHRERRTVLSNGRKQHDLLGREESLDRRVVEGHTASQPPSTTSSVPVMYEASSEARKSTA